MLGTQKDYYCSKSTQKARHKNKACHNIPHPKQRSARSRRYHLTNWITYSQQLVCAIISFTIHPIFSHFDQNLPKNEIHFSSLLSNEGLQVKFYIKNIINVHFCFVFSYFHYLVIFCELIH